MRRVNEEGAVAELGAGMVSRSAVITACILLAHRRRRCQILVRLYVAPKGLGRSLSCPVPLQPAPSNRRAPTCDGHNCLPRAGVTPLQRTQPPPLSAGDPIALDEIGSPVVGDPIVIDETAPPAQGESIALVGHARSD